MPTETVQAIAQALHGQKQSDGSWNVLCPAHDDKNPSCNVKDVGDKILVKCYAGCSQEAVISAFKSRNLWTQKMNGSSKWFSTKPAGIMENWHGKSLTAWWEYRDQAGVTIGYTARYDINGDDKDIIPYFKRSGDQWKPGGPADKSKPIYGIENLKSNDLPVLIVEGEKSAVAAHKLVGKDYICITWMGGTGSVNKVDWAPIQGREVFIWPDKDEPGTRAANTIKSKIPGARIVSPPKDAPNDGWDLADALADGWTHDHVMEHIKTAAGDPGQDDGSKIEIISLSEIIKINPTIEFIVDSFLIRKAGHILHAAGGVGKSTIAGQIAGELARDMPENNGVFDEYVGHLLFETFRIAQHGIQSLFLQSENSMATINNKMRWLKDDPAANRIFFPKLFDDVITTGEAFTDDNFIQKIADTIHFIEDQTGHRLDIVWVDPLISFHKGDENAADHMRAALDGVTKLMQMTNTTAVVLHHDNRQGDIRGSGAIDQWARSRMQMKQVWIGEDRIRDMGPDGPVKTVAKVPAVELHHKKANDMALFNKITLAQGRNLMFQLVPDPVDQETATRASEVVKALVDMGGACSSSRELYRAVSELTGRSESTCRKDVSDAVTLGHIERIPNKKGNVNTYGYQINA